MTKIQLVHSNSLKSFLLFFCRILVKLSHLLFWISVRRTHAQLTRTSSLVPPPSTLNVTINEWLSSSDTQINRVEHAPLSPQSSITSSGSSSDTHHEDGPQPVRNSFLEERSGMRGKLQ